MLDIIVFAVIFIITLIVATIYFCTGEAKTTAGKVGATSKQQITGEEREDSPMPGWSPEQSEEKLAAISSYHELLAELHQKHGPVAAFWMQGKHFISLASPGLFKQHSYPFDRPMEIMEPFAPACGSECLPFLMGDAVRARRKLFDQHFSHDGVAIYCDMLQEVANDLAAALAAFPKGQHVPIGEHVMKATLTAIIHAMVGPGELNVTQINTYLKHYNVVWYMLDKIGGFRAEAGTSERANFDKSVEAMHSIFRTVVTRRKESGGSDQQWPLDIFIQAGLSDQQQLHETMNSIIAGFHTSGRMLQWCLYFLSLHEDIQEQLYQEIDEQLGGQDVKPEVIPQLPYLRQVIEETLRCAKVLPYMVRTQPADGQIGGYSVKAGTIVFHAFGVVWEDPTIYPHPEQFDPDRFTEENRKKLPPYAFEPFGFAGGRKCVGFRFVYLEATVILCTLIRRFRFRLVEGQTITPYYGLVTRPAEEIWLTVEQR